MTDNSTDQGATVTAALLIIGDEILSGRTRDANLHYLATWLNEIGIQLMEVRVVPDDQDEIADAVNALRQKFTYLFTTGGIGPTHDDITVDSIAYALNVPVIVNPVADQLLRDYYNDGEYTPARQRMARTPEGAELVNNPISIAPGIRVGNIFILAGVPKIMQAMLEGVRPHLKGGKKMLTAALTIRAPESKMAERLAATQDSHSNTSIGSYPFYKDGAGGTQIVVRSFDAKAIDRAMADVRQIAIDMGFDHADVVADEAGAYS